MAAAFTAWSWLEANLPGWAIALIFINVFVVVFALINIVHTIVLRQKARSIDVPKAADDISRAVSQMRRTLDALENAMVAIRQAENESAGEFLQRKLNHDNAQRDEMARKFYSRHGGDIIASFRLIETIVQARIPFWVTTSLQGNPKFAVEYLSAASQLLAQGYIEEVRKMDKEFVFYLQRH